MRLACLLLPLAFIACGGSDGGSNQAPAEIDLTATGARTPIAPSVNIDLPSGGQVHFFNKDPAAPHKVASTDCAELNTAQLAANTDAPLITVNGGPKACTFKDELNPSNAAFNGNITVTAPGTPGGGY